MVRCLKAGIKTPVLRYVDMNRYCVIMSYIEGYTVRDYINKSLYSSGFILLICLQLEEELNRYCFKIGETVARLHNSNPWRSYDIQLYDRGRNRGFSSD